MVEMAKVVGDVQGSLQITPGQYFSEQNLLRLKRP